MAPIFTPYRKRISALRWAISTITVFTLIYVWGLFLRGDLKSFRVVSASMEPTLLVGDYVLTRPIRAGESLNGRVIAFVDPTHEGEIVTKRVVGVSGDYVVAVDSRVFVNSHPLPVPSGRIHAATFREGRIPKNHVFVLGDNRQNSTDSLDYGPIATEKVVGIVFFRYWPLSRMGRVR